MSRKWEDKGLVYVPPFDGSWKDNSALTPTPIIIKENEIRVYCGFRDTEGVSRIGYVDLEGNNPKNIIRISGKPVLEVGEPGMFDDNGIILGDVISVKKKILMYYVGFQLVNNVKFLAYSGLAISEDNGETFSRFSPTPIMDRSDEAIYIRAIHSVLFENGVYKIWYSTGSVWKKIGNKNYPCYDINYIETIDGLSFSMKGIKCILNNKSNKEYRIGRPRVYRLEDVYIMNFTYGTTDGLYQVGQAISIDGINWNRNDNSFNLRPGNSDWSSRHLCYPSRIKTINNEFIFFNGNDMGINGFGFAELIKIT